MQNILKEFKEKAPNVEISIQGTNCNNWLFHITWEKGKIDLCLE